jgi:hypothetical protein
MAGLGEAAGDYLSVFAGVAGWAIFGATLGVAFRLQVAPVGDDVSGHLDPLAATGT